METPAWHNGRRYSVALGPVTWDLPGQGGRTDVAVLDRVTGQVEFKEGCVAPDVNFWPVFVELGQERVALDDLLLRR